MNQTASGRRGAPRTRTPASTICAPSKTATAPSTTSAAAADIDVT